MLIDATIVNVHTKREDMLLNSFATSGLRKENPYGLTWENSMALKYDLYSNSMQSSFWVQFNIVLGILNADLEKMLLIDFLINSVSVKFP